MVTNELIFTEEELKFLVLVLRQSEFVWSYQIQNEMFVRPINGVGSDRDLMKELHQILDLRTKIESYLDNETNSY